METANLPGFAAGTHATIAFVPQVARMGKTCSAEDVSLPAIRFG